MHEAKVSRTAQYMALFRALEAARPASHRLFHDPLARAFLPGGLRLAAELARAAPLGALLRAYIDRRWPGARTSAVARTRFLDGAAELAIRSGAEQAVALGAGFDARAYRLAALDRVSVFEVDHPATSTAKRTAVAAALGCSRATCASCPSTSTPNRWAPPWRQPASTRVDAPSSSGRE